MTSPSRRKPRITRASTGRWAWINGSLVGAAALLCGTWCEAADTAWWGSEPRAVSSKTVAPARAPSSRKPVDPLRRRPVREDWVETNSVVTPPAPAAKVSRDEIRLVSHGASAGEASGPKLTGNQATVSATADFNVGDPRELISGRVGEIAPSLVEQAALQPEPEPLQPEPNAIPADDFDDSNGQLPDVEDEPRRLRKIGQILPYQDYEPDPDTAMSDAMKNLCPRPGATNEQCPEEIPWTQETYVGRAFEHSLYAWEAPNLAYNPLYFEDVQLERYGHSYPCLIQPFVSVAKFSQQVVWWPYHATLEPPDKCIYPLGYYRPGECAPKLCYTPPLNAHAGLVQAGAVTGMFFIFP